MGKERGGSFLCSRMPSGSLSFNRIMQWFGGGERQKSSKCSYLSYKIYHLDSTTYLSSQDFVGAIRVKNQLFYLLTLTGARTKRSSGGLVGRALHVKSLSLPTPICRKGMGTSSLWQITSKDSCQQPLPSL